MNTVFELMVEAMQAQTELMAQVIEAIAPADREMTVSVFSFNDDEDETDLEEGPLTEEEVADWIAVPEGTDPDLVLDIVRQVEEIYGIVDEEEWEEVEEDDEVEVEDEEAEEA